MTDPPPDGGGAVIAMTRALQESGFAASDVDYVVAHGTGTPAGDVSETVAIKRTFGDHAAELAVTSPKSMTGHTTCAAGALNLLAALGSIRDGVISPTINYDHPDPELDLDFVGNVARERDVRVAVTNAFAFGGTNGAMVVCAPGVGDGASS
jgi:3-oxoacyl-[acyl-carrier-protein] synthase II